jgi:hypothetical protein
MIKRFYSLGLISLLFISCSKDGITTDSESTLIKESKALDFESYETMDSRIDEINALKTQKESAVLKIYQNIDNSEFVLSENLGALEEQKIKQNIMIKNSNIYHNEKLKTIYELRSELNFTSIQSIADEINELKSLNSSQATSLFEKHKKFLKKTKFEVQTIFDSRIANVINGNGEVLVKGTKLDFNNSSSSNARYINDEDVLVKSVDYYRGTYSFTLRYYVGREYHRNSIGVGFYKYFTQLRLFYTIPEYGIYDVPLPATFNINPGSKAGFLFIGSAGIFCEYTITVDFPSGSGAQVRNVGGNRNCKMSPLVSGIGGFFSGSFTVVFNPDFIDTVPVDVKYAY